jgi:hypothetical protein
MARKKENSVAVWRDRPRNMPPMMVAPERLVPGIMARHCTRPTFSASSGAMSSTASMRTRFWRRSAHRMMKPPTMKALATTVGREQMRLDGLAEQQTEDDSREEGDADIQHEATRALLRGQLGRHALEALGVDQDHRQDGAGLDGDVEHLALGVVHAEQVAGQDQVPGGADRQEFGQALDDPHDRGLDQQQKVQTGSPAKGADHSEGLLECPRFHRGPRRWTSSKPAST